MEDEVVKFSQEEKPDLILWGCQPTPLLCRVIDRISISSLIIK
jgi:hypothetical protein